MKTRIHGSIFTLLLISVLLILSVSIGIKTICKTFIYPIKYSKYVQEAARNNNVDPFLIFAIIKQESNFNKSIVSRKNAKGLMQILDSTAEEIALESGGIDAENIDLFDASTNIYIGVKYFRTLLDRYNGNVRLAICAYNAGLGNVDKWILSEEIYANGNINISNIPFIETRNYLINILNYYDNYVNLYS